ncbi:MAG: F0F1 ATP synthase subunit A [Defluviitaleaceae bacterium]|nr:F0F1 ATP synthase subunit A [Defluviitaleaceae bacterium]
MDFNIRVFTGIRITDGLEFLITETTVNTWIVMGLILLFAIIVRIRIARVDPLARPKGLQNFIEMCVDGWEKFYASNTNPIVMYLAPWFFTLILFLLVSNAIGIVGLRPPTADWGMTFPLALSTFLLIQFAGVRHRPKSYLKSIFLEPVFLFAPLNVIGELARPISLSFRLFGNIFGGMVLLTLLYSLPWFVTLLLPIPLHMYFDLAAGLLQAVIFTMLSLTFVSLAAAE